MLLPQLAFTPAGMSLFAAKRFSFNRQPILGTSMEKCQISIPALGLDRCDTSLFLFE